MGTVFKSKKNTENNEYLNEWKLTTEKAGATKLLGSGNLFKKTSVMKFRYSRAHITDGAKDNHTLCKVNDNRNEWFTIKRALHHDTRNNTIEFEIRGMNKLYLLQQRPRT